MTSKKLSTARSVDDVLPAVLFHTLTFAFFFLIVLPVFLVVPQRARWAVLLFASLVFFGALGIPALVVALAAVTLASYVVGLMLDSVRPEPRAWFWAGMTFNVLVLAAFKFSAAVLVRGKRGRRYAGPRRSFLLHLPRHLLHRRRLCWYAET